MLRRGIVRHMCWKSRNIALMTLQNFWVKDHKQVYLTGNPVIWWSSSIAVALYLGMRALLILREKRGYRDLYQREITPI